MKLCGRPGISWGSSLPMLQLCSGRGSGGTGGMPAGSESARAPWHPRLSRCRRRCGSSGGVNEVAYRVYWIQKYGFIEKSIDVSSKEQAERLARVMEQYGDTVRVECVGDDA